jgi:hypothetical protein
VHAGMKLKQMEFAGAMPQTRCANLALQGGGAHGHLRGVYWIGFLRSLASQLTASVRRVPGR